VETARCELAAAFLDDLRRIDAQLLDVKKKLTVAVRASGTTLTGIFGAGPVVAATVIGAGVPGCGGPAGSLKRHHQGAARRARR
jgi:hypothetical protein